jgi:hypothetical protein
MKTKEDSTKTAEERAFEAGREYHDPGHRLPILRWKNYTAYINRMETHLEYGKEIQRRAV